MKETMTLFNDINTGEEKVLMTSDIVKIVGLNHPETGERFKIDGDTQYCRILMKIDRDKLEYRVLDKATGVTYICSRGGVEYLIDLLTNTEEMEKPLYTLSKEEKEYLLWIAGCSDTEQAIRINDYIDFPDMHQRDFVKTLDLNNLPRKEHLENIFRYLNRERDILNDMPPSLK